MPLKIKKCSRSVGRTQLHQARRCMPKTAFTVETVEMRLIIDMQPPDTFGPCRADGFTDQLPSNALPLHVGMHGRIEQKGMDAAIPGEVYKPNEEFLKIRTNVGQTAIEDWLEIGPGMIRPCRRKQGIERLVGHCRTDT